MPIEVLWQDPQSGEVRCLELANIEPPESGAQGRVLAVREVLQELPEALRARVENGELAMASHGQTRAMDSLLRAGDRLELLAAIQMDARAARAARVKQVRSRQRGPYNRSFSGTATTAPNPALKQPSGGK